MSNSHVNMQPVGTPATPQGVAPTRTHNTVKVRRARFRITRLDPWTVMKTSLLFSVSLAIISWVAVYVMWTVVSATGTLEALNQAVGDVLSSPTSKTPARIEDIVNFNKVMGLTTVVSVVNVILLTALATLFAFLYNLSANIFGGLEITLSED